MIEMPGFLLFTLIVMRMSGFILLNPIFGRRNVPNLVKAGLIMVISVCLFASSDVYEVGVNIRNSFDYGILLIMEFMIGFVLGFVMNLFFYIVTYAGGMIDFYMGMSMANIYDPQNNASMPLTGTLYNAQMIMLFFAVDGHVALLKIIMDSGQIVPYAQMAVSPQIVAVILEIFKDCTVLAVKMSFPFLALELLAEVGVGILMRVIPQINVFMVNIQAKVFIGQILFLVMCIPVGEFLGNVITQMINAVSGLLTFL